MFESDSALYDSSEWADPAEMLDAADVLDADDVFDADLLQGGRAGEPSAERMLGSAFDHAESYQLMANRECARLVFAVGDAFALALANPRIYVPVGAGEATPGVQDVDFAARSVAFDLSHRLNLSENVVRSYAHQAQVLDSTLPRLRDLFVSGLIGGQHARAAVENAMGLPDAAAAAKYDERLAAIAERTRPGEFARRCRVLRERLCVDRLLERHVEARAKRRTCFEPAPDGMAWASGFVAATDAARAEARLTAEARRLRRLPGERRTLDQIRADLYVAWLTGDADGGRDHDSSGVEGSSTDGSSTGSNSTDSGSTDSSTDTNGVAAVASNTMKTDSGAFGATAQVPSGVQPFLLIDAGGRFAELLGYGPVDPVSAMRALANAPSFRRAITDPVTPTRLILDRRQYRPTSEQKRWLRLNYGFTEAASSYVSLDAEIDHAIEWQHGGTTDIQNLVPLKPRLHRLKSVTRIRLDPKPDGGIRVRTPTGYDSDPPPF